MFENNFFLLLNYSLSHQVVNGETPRLPKEGRKNQKKILLLFHHLIEVGTADEPYFSLVGRVAKGPLGPAG